MKTSPRSLLVLSATAALAALAPRAAHAQARELGYAEDYAKGSVSLLGGGAFNVLAPTDRYGGSTTVGVNIGATVRLAYRHLVVQPGLGVSFQSTPPLKTTAFSGDLGAGYAFVLANRLALTPMATVAVATSSSSVDVAPPYGGSSSSTSLTVAAEVPLAIFVGRQGFIEPFFRAGYEAPLSSGDHGYAVIGGGYRLGVRF